MHESSSINFSRQDCDEDLLTMLPVRDVDSPEALLAPFKAHYSSQNDMQKFIDSPGSRAVFIMTYDSKRMPESPDKTVVHFNCGLETLASTLLLNKDTTLKDLDFLDVIKVDLSLVREWLGTKRGTGR